MRIDYKWKLSALSCLALGLAPAAQATEGYFSHAWGAVSKALAGADLAYPQDVLSGAMNPASLAFVPQEWSLGVDFFSPWREFSASSASGQGFPLAPGTIESDKNAFQCPDVGINWPLKDGKSAIGLIAYGNGGMNTDYRSNVFGAGEAGVNLEQLFVTPTYARKIGSDTSVGVSVVFARQCFSAKGLGSFAGFSSDPGHLSNKGASAATGVGAKVGVLHKQDNGVSIAATYQPKINMTTFKEYSGLFAGQGDFDIPENYSVGVAYEREPGNAWMLNVRHIRYSDVPAVGNPFATGSPLGSDNGPGFGWRDMTVFKLGTQWTRGATWTWRAGLSYGKQPIKGSEALFNILAPGVQEWQFTAGFGHKMGKGNLDFSLMYSPVSKVKGPNPMAPDQQIELSMHQWEASLGYTMKF